MKPDVFLADEERVPLIAALRRFALKLSRGSYRQSVLINAGIDENFRSFLDVNASPASFADELVAACSEYIPSMTRPGYHPLLQLLTYFTTPNQSYRLLDKERTLFKTILQRGHNNFKVQALWSSVGRIESPLNHPIGTGVLIAQDVLLTCSHVLSQTSSQTLWVRFCYHEMDSQGNVYQLNPVFTSRDPQPDHALLTVPGSPPQQPIYPINKLLERGQSLVIIHHPRGKPLQVSDPGLITKVEEKFVDHTLLTAPGSSGAPLFDKDWQFVALHRGTRIDQPSGTSEGVPLSALWETLTHAFPDLFSEGM